MLLEDTEYGFVEAIEVGVSETVIAGDEEDDGREELESDVVCLDTE